MAQSRPFHSLKHELDALRSWHVDLGFPLNAFSHGRLEQVVCGIKHTHGLQPAASKLPITLPPLRALLEQLQRSPSLRAWDRQVVAAAFTVSFACFLRCGEVTWDQASPTWLLVSSLTWHGDYAILLLPASKTDPFQLGTPLSSPESGVGNVLTVCSASSALQSAAPTNPSLGCTTATSHSLIPSSYSTFAQHSLASALILPIMPDTLFARERLHGQLHKALTPTPSSSSANGIPIAIDAMSTVLLPSAARW
ncbi:uncharacterized protein UHOD_11927 [Ustilago sp. UG-2017b]|nr:uncharacterized protein UHOD_11927 [Ustilago sp. UG-2017b]